MASPSAPDLDPMTFVPGGNCSAAFLYVHYGPLYAVHWAQSLLALATLICCLLNLPLARVLRRKKASSNNNGTSTLTPIHFHVNVKVILVGAFIFYSLHSLVMFGMHFGYVVLFHLPTLQNNCFYTIITWKCLLLRMPSYIAVAGFTFVHLALCLERATASWYIHGYEQFSAKLGTLLLVPMFLGPIAWNGWIFHNEELNAPKAYCMSSSEFSSPRQLQMSYILIGLDLLAVLIDFGLYTLNRRQKEQKIVGYTLRKSFQLRENATSMRLILPLSICHSTLFICFLAVYSSLKIAFDQAEGLVYATVVESAHVIETLYTLISVGLFLVLRRRLAAQMNRLANEMRLAKKEQAIIQARQYQKFW